MLSVCIILLFAFMFISILWYSYSYGITPTPTSLIVQEDLKKILPILPKDALIMDLGSGWGNSTIALHHFYPSNPMIGFEISPIPFLVAKLFMNKSHIQYVRKDFFKVNLTGAQLIFCYLYPGAMHRLKEKFQLELKSGTYVVTHTFSIIGWSPIKIVYANDMYKTPIYLYRI